MQVARVARLWAAPVVLAVVVGGCGSATSPAVPPVGSAVVPSAGQISSPSPIGSQTAVLATPPPSGDSARIVVPSASPESALKVLWQNGGPTAPVAATTGPAVDPSGRIWVAASHANAFWIFDSAGKYLESWGTAGTANGQFEFEAKNEEKDPYGAIAFEPDGSFFVADTGNQRVQAFDKGRSFVRAWGTFGPGDGQFVTPGSISVDRHGHVLVADSDRQDIQVFTTDGQFVRSIGSGAVGAQDPVGFVYVDSADAVYTDEGPTVSKYSIQGDLLATYDLSSLTSYPLGIATDAGGDIFVATETTSGPDAQDQSLIELSPSGDLLHVWPPVGEELALDPSSQAAYTAFFKWDHIEKVALPGD